ncbi:DUF433 domain-containing protein [Ralstonia flaminis]|jgi:uncharacterized protein (DUF433 family)|uniref:DUF433 domain-containing protein n=1 Tax=Ralstonia flaminis TaxID=3058597 RepID=A0ABM9KDR9_9RALS|nr:DUF433 domain-containing protein [Ralstonia sp. LMG 18101]CAJ0822700.1 hypothetical protein LMG18101_05140 [Ralstonia sp. LMG 18101]
MFAANAAASTAEIAFLADLSDREINRLVDDNVLPRALVARNRSRRFAPLAAAFAEFYFQTSECLTRSARMHVIEALTERVLAHPQTEALLMLSAEMKRVRLDWTVAYSGVTVELTPYVKGAMGRVERVRRALRSIVEDQKTLGGMPCFKGTRLPIANVLGMVDEGTRFEELCFAYPFLTVDLIEDAQIYAKTRPRLGRPRRIKQMFPGARLVRSKVVQLHQEPHKAASSD